MTHNAAKFLAVAIFFALASQIPKGSDDWGRVTDSAFAALCAWLGFRSIVRARERGSVG